MIVNRDGHDFPSSYRPCRISEVYGQNEIKEIIKNGLNNGNLARSLFFYGVSGTGKTTISRIIGMGLLCKEGPTSEPCCECDACKAIMKGNTNWGYKEINAADCSGIDFMRDLCNSFYSYPMSGEKQIFVFDESHNLSKKAQDLLLKEVEDSPDHNYFTFCSTEPDNMLETLRNRCEPHEFREMPSADLKTLLNDVCTIENVDSNDEIFEKISNESKGMARNALVLLRKKIAAGTLQPLPDSGKPNNTMKDSTAAEYVI
jgi:DNA polymerase-3 subunit gamma/tau